MPPRATSTRSAGDAGKTLPPGAGQLDNSEKGNPLDDELKEFVDSIGDHYHVSGVSIGVVNGDETHLSGYGHAKLDPNVDATQDTLFYIGSATKGVLAASLLHTLESTAATSDKPITLDTKIRDIIPDDFVTTDEFTTQRATLRDALYHRLGYPRHDLSYGGPGFTVKDAVRSLRHLPTSAELREKFQYFNMGYMILQHVIETITRRWCGDVYNEAVFEPLGMSSSTVELKRAQQSSQTLATGYANTATETNPQPWFDSRLVGQGGVISNARDMAKYLHAMINRSGLDLSEDSYRKLFLPGMIGGGAPPKDHSPHLYAAGWVVSAYRGHHFIQHAGGVPGFGAIVGFLPAHKWGAVILTNGDFGGFAGAEAIFYRLMDDFLGVPADDRVDHVEKWDGIRKMKETAAPMARERVYPAVSSPPLPHSIPLDEYAGTYSHPAYGELTFEVAKAESDVPVAKTTTQILHAVKKQSEWNVAFDLEHVTGEHFICYIDTLVRSPLVQLAVEPYKAQFEVGADGKVSRLGIQIESGLEKIWFVRG